MADSPLIDIFDLCVERLAAGETVEDCLRDYPAYVDELRSLLETGFLVFQAQADPAEEQRAQAHSRSRIEEALQTDFAPHTHKGRNSMSTDLEPGKKKNTLFTLRRSVIMLGSAATAVFVFAMVFTFATTLVLPPRQPRQQTVADASLYMTNVYLRDLLATEAAREVIIQPGQDTFILTATAYIREITQTVVAEVLSRGTPVPSQVPIILTATQYIFEVSQTAAAKASMTTTPMPVTPKNLDEYELMATANADADPDRDGLSNIQEAVEFGTDPQKYDTDGDGISDGDEINKYGSNPILVDTADEFALTATAYSDGSPEKSLTGLARTLTALPTMAAVGTTAPELGASAGGDTAITGEVVSTSVALYLPMTSTPFAMMEAPGAVDETDKDLSAVSGRTDPASPPEPVVAGEERDRDAEKSDDFSADGRTDSLIVPYSGDAIPLPMPLATIVPSSGMLGLDAPVLNRQEQLDPMKAGEIDDNAEWDTYTEFRRNYISSYGAWTVNDLDVSSRRIIKVVDAAGKLIMGASVIVYMDQLKVSNTLTYATGMTLFFPNAIEDTKRRDEFEIVVSYDQYVAYYTLDLRKVGDVVEIQMPIVIIRDPAAPPYVPMVPTAPNIEPVNVNIGLTPSPMPYVIEATLVPTSTPISATR